MSCATPLRCAICNDYKEGFYGEHELRRHIQRTHQDVATFICTDISPDPMFLANCKHRRNMKIYGADYNAAAYLEERISTLARRPRVTGKLSQKRGVIGGGNEPPMEVGLGLPIRNSTSLHYNPPSYHMSSHRGLFSMYNYWTTQRTQSFILSAVLMETCSLPGIFTP